MPLGYNPSEMDPSAGRAEPGTYRFRVDEAAETTFRSGSHGLKLVLLVAAYADRDISVYDNLVYHPKALWKVDAMLKSVGLDFSSPPEAHELIGRQGVAEFRLGERGYLEVAKYVPAVTDAPAANKVEKKASPAPQRQQSMPYQPQHPPQRREQTAGWDEPPPYNDSDIPF